MRRAGWALAIAVIAAPASADEQGTPPAPGATASAGPDGFVLQSESGDYRLQVRGYVQFDGRFFPGDDARVAADTFLIRRARPIVQGTVAKHFEFNVTPDFGGGTTALQDAYLNVRYSAKAQVRVGKFKSPVGLERLQSAAFNSFVERAYPTALVPNRDVGVMLHGELGGGVVGYAAGVFDGTPDGGSVDIDTNDGKDLAARVFLSPFKRGSSFWKDLGLGIAGTTGKQSGPLPTYRSTGQLSIISFVTGLTADGTRTRYSPQLSFYSGPFGLLAEYAESESFVRKASGERAQLTATAWQTTATVTLTGDTASYAGVKPKSAFDPGHGKWGAFELAARVHGIEFGGEAVTAGLVDPARSIRKAFAWAVGVNWYLNRNVKQMVDFERTAFDDGGAAGADRQAENAIFIRSQVSF